MPVACTNRSRKKLRDVLSISVPQDTAAGWPNRSAVRLPIGLAPPEQVAGLLDRAAARFATLGMRNISSVVHAPAPARVPKLTAGYASRVPTTFCSGRGIGCLELVIHGARGASACAAGADGACR